MAVTPRYFLIRHPHAYCSNKFPNCSKRLKLGALAIAFVVSIQSADNDESRNRGRHFPQFIFIAAYRTPDVGRLSSRRARIDVGGSHFPMKVVEAAETESRHSGLRITDGAALTATFSLRMSDVVLDVALKHVASPAVSICLL